MTLYRWRSDALKNYQDGHIIVVADTPELAREKLRPLFDAWLRDHREWLFDLTTGEPSDEFDQREYERLLALFEADIGGDPEVAEHFFVAGSE